MKLVSDRLENTLEIKRLNKRCLHKVAHNRQEQPYESSKAISHRWWQGNCKKCKKMGKYDAQEKKTTMKGTGWEEKGKETTDVGTTLARRTRGGWGKASPEPREEGLEALQRHWGEQGHVYILQLFLGYYFCEVFQNAHVMSWEQSQALSNGWVSALPQPGLTCTIFFQLASAKRSPATGPQQPRQRNVLFHMCADLCLKMKARAYLRNWSSPGILWSNRFLVLWKWGFKPC